MAEENRVETRSLRRKREASAEDPKAKEEQQEKKRFEGFIESLKKEGKSLDANSNSPSSNPKFQRGWGGRNAPRMPNPEDLAAYTKAIKENKLFDIPVSSSGYLMNAVQPVRNIKEPLYLKLAKLAIKAYNEKQKDSEYAVKEVEKANMKLAGSSFNYYITFKASCANKDPISFQAEVIDDRSSRKVIVMRVHQSGYEIFPKIRRVYMDMYFKSNMEL